MTRLTFRAPAQLQIVERIKGDKPSTNTEDFNPCEEIEVEIFGQTEETVDIQFGDGTVSVGVPKHLFEEFRKPTPISQHNPLPWKPLSRGNAGIRIDIEDATGDKLGQIYMNDFGRRAIAPRRRDNAAHVLVACNTHQQLVETLTHADEILDTDKGLRGSGLHQAIKQALHEVERQRTQVVKALGKPTP